jgi:hypothetical protein
MRLYIIYSGYGVSAPKHLEIPVYKKFLGMIKKFIRFSDVSRYIYYIRWIQWIQKIPKIQRIQWIQLDTENTGFAARNTW